MANKPDIIKTYPDESLLEELRRAADLVDTPVLTKDAFTKASGLSAEAVARRFNGWRAALERAGLAHMYHGETDETRLRYSDETMVEELRRVAMLVDKPRLTRSDFKLHSKISLNAICLRFGPSWADVLNRADLGDRCNIVKHFPDEILLEALKKAAVEAGKPMSQGRILSGSQE